MPPRHSPQPSPECPDRADLLGGARLYGFAEDAKERRGLALPTAIDRPGHQSGPLGLREDAAARRRTRDIPGRRGPDPGDLKAHELVFADNALVSVTFTFDAILKLMIRFREQSQHLEAVSSEGLLLTIGGKADALPDRKFV